MSTRTSRNALLLVTTLALGRFVGGCSLLSPQPDRSRYFVLMPKEGTGETPAAAGVTSRNSDVAIGLGPISLPNYLDRPEVVTRLSDTEVSVSNVDRWGEPLGSSVSRVLAQDLSSEWPGLQVVQFPWSRKARIDYTASVDFLRLEKTADGKANVQAVWVIREASGNKLLQSGTTTASLDAGADQSSASAALSEGVARVARDITHALPRSLQKRIAPDKRPPHLPSATRSVTAGRSS